MFTPDEVNRLYVEKYGERQDDGQMVAGHEFDAGDPMTSAPPFIATN